VCRRCPESRRGPAQGLRQSRKVCGKIAADPALSFKVEWLPLHDLRKESYRTILKLLKAAIASGELPAQTDAARVAQFYTTFAHGISIQAARHQGQTRSRKND
jgi:hypothetical protein